MANTQAQVLQAMSKRAVTLGWDVIVAYNASALNDLFAAQYVQKMRLGQDLPPITTTLDPSTGVTIDVENLTLGPPLIYFDPSVSDQEVTVNMPFVAGELLISEISGKVQYVTGYQSIVPGDGYQLTMVVPLEQATGSDKHNVVTINLANASSYKANLLPGTTAASYLGQFFDGLFEKAAGSSLTYTVGTMVTGSSENLTPISFDIRTQVYPGTQSGDGAVLLLVATTYNPNGGEIPGSGFPYLIPDGNGCTMVVRGATLFQNIIQPYLLSLTAYKNASFGLDYYSGSAPAAYLSCTGGTFDAGTANYNHSSWGAGWIVWSGTKGSGGGRSQNFQSIQVPYQGWTLQPDTDLLTMNWDGQFSQPFGSIFWWSGAAPGSTSHYGSIELTITANVGLDLAVSSTQQIEFTGSGNPTANVSFSNSTWYQKIFKNGVGRDLVGGLVASAATQLITQAMKVPVPQVNTFAANHLLFPANNDFTYSTAKIPGDLVAFGQIQPTETAFQITPLQAVIGAGETQQFSVAGGGSTSWSLASQIGSISAAGLYTAPSRVPKALPVLVNATQGANSAMAIVTVVPYDITIAPSYAMVFNNANPVTFYATVLGGGGAPVWSISPADGSLGTVSADGVYTAPATFPSDVAIATVTATAGGAGVSATICLADVTLGLTPSPLFAALGPGQSQQFAVSGSPPAWSIQPALGTISGAGLYTAPATIAQAATVLAIASIDGEFYGVAPIILQPATEGTEPTEIA